MRVSVLMPVFNCEATVAESIESILGQTYRDFEFVIVNDGSTDNSLEIIKSYAGKDERIKIINNEKNIGISSSLNIGLRHCSGEYIVRMDADDIAYRDRLERQLDYLSGNGDVVLLAGAVEYIDPYGKALGVTRESRLGKSFLFSNTILHPTVVLDRGFLVDNGINYREKYTYAEDYFMWLEIHRLGRLAVTKDVVLKYRIRPNASRFKHLKAMLRSTLLVKLDGIRKLGIRPRAIDLLRMLAECLLLLLPAKLIKWLYIRKTFGRNI